LFGRFARDHSSTARSTQERSPAVFGGTHARVRKREKDRTKTGEDREIALCPRVFQVLQRQLALRQTLAPRAA